MAFFLLLRIGTFESNALILLCIGLFFGHFRSVLAVGFDGFGIEDLAKVDQILEEQRLNGLLNKLRQECSKPDFKETEFMSFLNLSKEGDSYVALCDTYEKALNYKSGEALVFADKASLFQMTLGGVGTSLRQVRRFPRQEIPPNVLNASVPKEFDARQRWPKCASIRAIKSQGTCQGCWATAVTSALDDRLCIFSEGNNFSVSLSAQDLIHCCLSCGSCYKGCEGGVAEMAYDYFVTTGLVTGGGSPTSHGCSPYVGFSPEMQTLGFAVAWSVEEEDNFMLGNINDDIGNFQNEICPHECSNPDYPVKYQDDKLKGKAWFMVTKFDKDGNISISDTERNTQLEIMTNGSVTVTIQAYKDLKTYKKGVYNTSSGELHGYHVMRCIGWGVDNATQQPYWLLANSWGPKWGEKGLMRIRRGQDIAGVESRISAGIPAQYSRIFTPAGPKEGIIMETARSKTMPYAGISRLWREKLYLYENRCAKAHRGQENYGKEA